MTGKPGPAVRKALCFLRTSLRGKAIPTGSALPAISVLARQAGVSRMSMWKAQALLKREGILSGYRGSGTFAGARENPHAADGWNARRPACLVVRDEIRRDLLNGTFAPNQPLPSAKLLRNRYGVCHRTLLDALRICTKDRVLLRRQRRYIPAAMSSAARGRLKVLFLGHGPGPGRLWLGELDRQLLQCVDRECRRSRLDLEPVVFHGPGEAITLSRHTTGEPFALEKRDEIAGIILHVISVAAADRAFIRRVVALGKPVAIIDMVGGWSPPDLPRAGPVRRFTATACAAAPRAVARLLLESGHRRCAFISPYAGGWAQTRFSALVEEFEAADRTAAVIPFVSHDIILPEQFLDHPRRSGLPRELDALLGEWQTRLGHSHREQFCEFFGEPLRRTWIMAETRRRTATLCSRALRDCATTAWITANDDIAGFALDFLDARRVPVPDRISLLSFDNSERSLARGITSYDFNINGLAAAVVDFLMRPRSVLFGKPGTTVEIEGFLIQRRSSARAA